MRQVHALCFLSLLTCLHELRFTHVCNYYLPQSTCNTITRPKRLLYATRALNSLAEAGAKLNVPTPRSFKENINRFSVTFVQVPNRLGVCPVDAAKDDGRGPLLPHCVFVTLCLAVTWLEERGFHPDEAMVQVLVQHEAMEKETMQSGALPWF